MSTIRDRAIEIVVNTFIFDYEGTPKEIYNKLINEDISDWRDIEYAAIAQTFEENSVEDIVFYMTSLVDSIVAEFQKSA